MAPISEKRPTPPHMKDNAKENASNTMTKKHLEILDFHESWLRDIELYKNQVKIQQMLSTHNHVHTAEGCVTEAFHITPRKRVNSYRPASVVSDLKVVEAVADYENSNLKRPREDPAKYNNGKTNNVKRNNTNATGNLPPSQHSRNTEPALATAKIIVNSFHASNLLNSKHGDLTARLLVTGTQTAPGLRNPHKPKNNVPSSLHKHEEQNPPKTSTPLSTSLDRQTLEEQNDTQVADEDTGSHANVDDDDNSSVNDIGDIDDLNAFEDSEDDSEEYVGSPFVLQNDTHLSCMSEAITQGTTTPKSVLTPSLFPQVPPYLTFSSHMEKGPSVPAVLHKVLKWKLSPVMPRIVRRVIFNSGFRLIKKTTDWMAVWEKHMRSPGFKTIRSHQKFNHLPGSFRIGRKDSMWKNIKNFSTKHGKKEFGFMQKTYILPEEVDELKKAWTRYSTKGTKWIVKPPASARGAGISVVNKWSQIPKDKPVIVQKYIEKPLLINENKFDLRLYILVTSINPLRIFMYKNGLARFASVKYSSELTTLNDRCMHLTNYSINKLSQNYAKNEDINACQGHKWTLQSFWSYLEKRDVDTKRLWGTLRNLVIKSIISGEGCLNRMYRQNVNSRYNCYELFGFDVLLDENLVPWLLEINISPSLHSELPLDLHVKGPLIQGVLNTALYQVPPKLTIRQQAEILNEMKLTGPLCYDRHIFTPLLSAEEIKKHNFFTSRLCEYREEYLDNILENLTPDDVRCLLISEDELARSEPLERIFPNSETFKFLQFVENPRYYNRLLDAWETRYGKNREKGIQLLQRLCGDGYHLQVPPAALIEEPKIDLTDIDLMYMKPDEIPKRRDSNSAEPTKPSDSLTNKNVDSPRDSPPIVTDDGVGVDHNSHVVGPGTNVRR